MPTGLKVDPEKLDSFWEDVQKEKSRVEAENKAAVDNLWAEVQHEKTMKGPHTVARHGLTRGVLNLGAQSLKIPGEIATTIGTFDPGFWLEINNEASKFLRDRRTWDPKAWMETGISQEIYEEFGDTYHKHAKQARNVFASEGQDFQRASRFLQQIVKDHPEWAPRQIEKAMQILTRPDATAQIAIEAAPQMGAMILTTKYAGPKAGALFIYGLSRVILRDQALADIELLHPEWDDEKKERYADTYAQVASIGTTILEFTQIQEFFRFGKDAKRLLIHEMVKKMGKKATAKELGKRTLLHAAAESLEEILQGTQEELVALQLYGKPIEKEDFVINRLLEAIAVSFSTTLFGLSGAGVADIRARRALKNAPNKLINNWVKEGLIDKKDAKRLKNVAAEAFKRKGIKVGERGAIRRTPKVRKVSKGTLWKEMKGHAEALGWSKETLVEFLQRNYGGSKFSELDGSQAQDAEKVLRDARSGSGLVPLSKPARTFRDTVQENFDVRGEEAELVAQVMEARARAWAGAQDGDVLGWWKFKRGVGQFSVKESADLVRDVRIQNSVLQTISESLRRIKTVEGTEPGWDRFYEVLDAVEKKAKKDGSAGEIKAVNDFRELFSLMDTESEIFLKTFPVPLAGDGVVGDAFAAAKVFHQLGWTDLASSDYIVNESLGLGGSILDKAVGRKNIPLAAAWTDIFSSNGILWAYRRADLGTLLHEVGHLIEDDLNRTQIKALSKRYSTQHFSPRGELLKKGGPLGSEAFANDFIAWIEGSREIKDPALRSVFEQLKLFLSATASMVSREGRMNPELNRVLKELFNTENPLTPPRPDKIVAKGKRVRTVTKGTENRLHNTIRGLVNKGSLSQEDVQRIAIDVIGVDEKGSLPTLGYNTPLDSIGELEANNLIKRLYQESQFLEGQKRVDAAFEARPDIAALADEIQRGALEGKESGFNRFLSMRYFMMEIEKYLQDDLTQRAYEGINDERLKILATIATFNERLMKQPEVREIMKDRAASERVARYLVSQGEGIDLRKVLRRNITGEKRNPDTPKGKRDTYYITQHPALKSVFFPFIIQRSFNKDGSSVYTVAHRTEGTVESTHNILKDAKKALVQKAYDELKLAYNEGKVSKESVQDYWEFPKDPQGIMENEIAIAEYFRRLFQSFETDIRVMRFIDWYESGTKIPDVKSDVLREISNKWESQGFDENWLIERLEKESWGVIESGYEPTRVATEMFTDVAPHIATQAYGSSSTKARRTGKVQYLAQDNNIFKRTQTYMYQILVRRYLSHKVENFKRRIEEGFQQKIDDIEIPEGNTKETQKAQEARAVVKEKRKRVGDVITNWQKDAYRIPLGSDVSREWISRIYATVAPSIFARPRLAYRNLHQNLAFFPWKSDLFNPKNIELSGGDKKYFDIYVDQAKALEWYLFFSDHKGIPYLEKVAKLARDYSAYAWSDKQNRRWAFWAARNKAKRAFKGYNEALSTKAEGTEASVILTQQGALSKLMSKLDMSFLQPIQQRLFLEKLAMNGEDAASRYYARCVVENVHFLYDRSQRSPSEHRHGRIYQNLINFRRSYVEMVGKDMKVLMKGGKWAGRRKALERLLKTFFIGGILVNRLYKLTTGSRWGAYSPFDVIQGFEIGGLMIGSAETLGETLLAILAAIKGDKESRNKVTELIPRSADIAIPFYHNLLNIVESVTDTRHLDTYALRKVRAAVDKRYKPKDKAYRADRTLIEALQHGIFGTDPQLREEEEE